MADYISREAAVETLRPYKIDPFKIGFLDDNIDGFNDGIDTAISCISVEVPTADVRPVVRGKWEDETGFIFSDLSQQVRCSKCGLIAYFYDKMPMNFCPNCGADMREVKTNG